MNIRCPSCSTLFSASDEVIEAGHGLVRCSRCRNVFKAAENVEPDPDSELDSDDDLESTQETEITPDEPTRDSVKHLPVWLRGELIAQLSKDAIRGRRFRIVLGILLIIAFSATLAGQVAYSQIGTFSQIGQIRPAMQWLCQVAGCDLPPLRDLETIRLVDSQISWLENESIDLKISISNESEFDQSYPAVHISMSNYLGQIVAEGRFRPEEYATSSAQVGAGETVVINLLIKNPGQRIRSYDIGFY